MHIDPVGQIPPAEGSYSISEAGEGTREPAGEKYAEAQGQHQRADQNDNEHTAVRPDPSEDHPLGSGIRQDPETGRIPLLERDPRVGYEVVRSLRDDPPRSGKYALRDLRTVVSEDVFARGRVIRPPPFLASVRMREIESLSIHEKCLANIRLPLLREREQMSSEYGREDDTPLLEATVHNRHGVPQHRVPLGGTVVRILTDDADGDVIGHQLHRFDEILAIPSIVQRVVVHDSLRVHPHKLFAGEVDESNPRVDPLRLRKAQELILHFPSQGPNPLLRAVERVHQLLQCGGLAQMTEIQLTVFQELLDVPGLQEERLARGLHRVLLQRSRDGVQMIDPDEDQWGDHHRRERDEELALNSSSAALRVCGHHDAT